MVVQNWTVRNTIQFRPLDFFLISCKITIGLKWKMLKFFKVEHHIINEIHNNGTFKQVLASIAQITQAVKTIIILYVKINVD